MDLWGELRKWILPKLQSVPSGAARAWRNVQIAILREQRGRMETLVAAPGERLGIKRECQNGPQIVGRTKVRGSSFFPPFGRPSSKFPRHMVSIGGYLHVWRTGTASRTQECVENGHTFVTACCKMSKRPIRRVQRHIITMICCAIVIMIYILDIKLGELYNCCCQTSKNQNTPFFPQLKFAW